MSEPLAYPPAGTRGFEQPDDVRVFPKGHWEVVQVGGRRVARITFEPGFQWSVCVGPVVGTALCQLPHTNYIVSGRLRTRLADGTELETGAGELSYVPPGHDGWVVGDEPVVMIDFSGQNPGVPQ